MVLGFEMVLEKIICNLFSNYSISQVVFTVHCVMIIASFDKKHCYNKIFLACLVCRAESRQQYGVCPSVCPIGPLQQHVGVLLLWAERVHTHTFNGPFSGTT